MDKLKMYSKSLLISVIITLILLLVGAVLLTYTSIPENMINVITFVSIIVAVFIGSYILAKNIKAKGILHGGVFGAMYFVLLYLLTCMFYGAFIFNINTLIYLAICLIAGTVSGIIGVNR